MRLLVVEDDKILAEGLMDALKQAGYAVDHVANGEIANTFIAANCLRFSGAGSRFAKIGWF